MNFINIPCFFYRKFLKFKYNENINLKQEKIISAPYLIVKWISNELKKFNL